MQYPLFSLLGFLPACSVAEMGRGLARGSLGLVWGSLLIYGMNWGSGYRVDRPLCPARRIARAASRSRGSGSIPGVWTSACRAGGVSARLALSRAILLAGAPSFTKNTAWVYF